jgi:sugar phosphate isomerase/epimerase
MKLGLLTAPLGDRDRAAALRTARELGFDAVELGTGEFTADHHVGLEQLSRDPAAVAQLQTDLDAAGLELSALSCHGNLLHPNAAYAARADAVFRKTVELAAALGTSVNLFSGCPGDPDGGDYPNWICTRWPGYFGDLLDWQWRERVLPYWREAAAYAADRGVRLAIEMHPGNVVYNTDALLHLRAECGESIGANFDPSHLWWQGMDPLVAVRAIAQAGALFNVHAKDTYLDRPAIERNGVIATEPGAPHASWRFATVGYGHDLRFWRAFVNELRSLGWDGVVSVEHEDELAPIDEALVRSVHTLRACIWDGPADGYGWLEGTDPPHPSPDNPWGETPPGGES